MIFKKAVNFLKSVLLPITLYLLLFNPFYSEQDQHISITRGDALISMIISLFQLGTTVLFLKLIHKKNLSDTGLFSFSKKTLLNIIPSMLIVYGIYLAGILVVLIVTGSAEDPGIITIELGAPLWMLALLMLCIGYCEETFFRVYLVDTLGTVLGRKAAIIISAFLFAIGHLYQGYLSTAIIFFLGLGFQWIYYKYRSIHVNAIVHALFDTISVLVKGC